MVLVTFGSVLISIIAFVFVLCTIVSLHELGHFFFAVKGGILCREYAIGMGPLLWKKKKGETQYSIRAFPIGGFCAIAGEVTEDDPLKDKEKVRLFIEDNIVKKICVDVDLDIFNDLPLYNLKEYDLYDANNTGHLYIKVANDEGEEITYDVANDASYVFPTLLYKKSNKPVEEKKKKCIDEIQIAPYNRQLNSKSIGRRAMVMFGGPLMNMILALVAFFFAYLISGVSNTSTTVLSEVSEGTPAYVAGLRGGYEITGMETTDLNGENYSNLNIDEWDDISLFLKGYKDNDASSSEIKVYYKNPDTGEIDNVTVKPMVIIYSISMMQDIESDDVKIAPLNTASKAYKAGLREGDIITKVNDIEINTWLDVYHQFKKAQDGKTIVSVTVNRDENGENKEYSFDVKPYSKKLFERTQNVNYVDMQIGISPVTTHNVFKVVGTSFKEMGLSIYKLFNTLGMLLFSSEVHISDLTGVVGIFRLTSQAASSGFSSVLYLLGFLSVNIGFVNLLPIPALDGGRLLFLLIELIRRKPVSEKAQTRAINITMILLYALMIYVVINDVLRLFR